MPFQQTQYVTTLAVAVLVLLLLSAAGDSVAHASVARAQPAEVISPPHPLSALPDTARADSTSGIQPSGVGSTGLPGGRAPALVAPGTLPRGTIADALLTSHAPELDAPVGSTIVTEVEPDTVHVFTDAPPLWIGQPTLPEARNYENAFFRADRSRPAKSQRGPSPVSHPSGNDKPGALPATLCPPTAQVELADPEVFDRTPTMLPPGRVEYYFSAPDSVVHCAIYRWDETSHMSGMEFIRMMRQGGVQPSTVLATYDVVFDEVARYVSRQVGPPGTLDPSPRKTNDRRINYRREARWSTSDVVIDLRLSVNRVGGHLTVVQYWK